VGSILAANFAKIGQKVVLIEAAEPRRQQIAEHGLSVVGRDTYTTRDVEVVPSIEALAGKGLEAIFICTKTWSLRRILPQLAEALDPETLVVSFQNGIGPEDEVAKFFPREHVARGIVNYAGGVHEDGGVAMAWFNPPNYLGPLEEASTQRLRELATVLTEAGLETHAIPLEDTKKLVFFKTILNSALNALCAANGITMRQAMTYRHTRNLARMLIKEGLSVATAVGYTYGENAMEVCMKYLDEGGDHLPSMWTDLQRGTRTEIEYINGKIVKIATMFKNIDVDANIFFTSAIVTQEIKTGVREPDEIPEYLTYF
jgi:2-dehydropantoate 2-reductase